MKIESSEWTDEIAEHLREVYPTLSGYKIADLLNETYGTSFTRSAVVGKAARMGLKKFRKFNLAPHYEVNTIIGDKKFRDIKPRECAWLHSEGADSDYCGKPVYIGHEGKQYSYCRGCCDKVYNPDYFEKNVRVG